MIVDDFIDSLTIGNATCFFAKFLSIIFGGFTYLYLAWNERRVMRRQPKGQSRNLILPFYKPLMAFVVIFLVVENAFFFFLMMFDLSPWFNVLQWGMFQIPRQGFCMIFLQRSVSRRAIRRAFKGLLAWTFYGMAMGVFLNVAQSSADKYLVAMLYHAAPTLFHFYMLLSSCFRSLPYSPRETLIPYAALMFPGNAIWVILYFYLYLGHTEEQAQWMFLTAGALELPMTPFWLLMFRADTHYWQYGGVWSWIRSPDYFALDEDDASDEDASSSLVRSTSDVESQLRFAAQDPCVPLDIHSHRALHSSAGPDSRLGSGAGSNRSGADSGSGLGDWDRGRASSGGDSDSGSGGGNDNDGGLIESSPGTLPGLAVRLAVRPAPRRRATAAGEGQGAQYGRG